MRVNERGQRFHAPTSRRKGRVNTIANALCNQKVSASFTIEGSCNRTVFEMWLETCLVPTLITGQVIVMDNATFHILRLFEALSKFTLRCFSHIGSGFLSPNHTSTATGMAAKDSKKG